MCRDLFRASSRVAISAMLLTCSLLIAGLFRSAWADEIADPTGDILPTYTGVKDPGMDVVAHEVTVIGDRVIFFGRMAGPIAPTKDIGGLYLFGLDRGLGTARFLGPAAPPVIGPNVLWDSIVRINPDGTGLFNNTIAGVITPLDPADITIDGDEFTASVPLSLLEHAATRPPLEWTYNLWPRNGIGRNVQVSDLAPDDGNSPVQSAPALQADAGPDQTVECDFEGGAMITLNGGVAGNEDSLVSFKWSAPNTVLLQDDASASVFGLFPLGTTEVTLSISDPYGRVAVDTVRITVVDTIPPEVACTTDVAALWPPNHQMVEVGVFVSATDACTHPDELVLLEVVITSDEPDDARGGDGDVAGDVEGEDGFAAAVDVTRHFTFNPRTSSFEGSVFLRAERAGQNSGRTYTIKATVLDSHNNVASASCAVVVPHHRSR